MSWRTAPQTRTPRRWPSQRRPRAAWRVRSVRKRGGTTRGLPESRATGTCVVFFPYGCLALVVYDLPLVGTAGLRRAAVVLRGFGVEVGAARVLGVQGDGLARLLTLEHGE